jgi:uncharacterized damage-inducible protein DinB
LVAQLRFTRSEFQRALDGVTEEEAKRRFEPMNCISWNVGHLAWQEQRYWLRFAQNKTPIARIQTEFAYGAPPTTPSLAEIQTAWRAITTAADPWLEQLASRDLQTAISRPGAQVPITYGSLLLRTIYHYWYHLGENLAIRQQLGHTNLPEFVGNIDEEAPYRAEESDV